MKNQNYANHGRYVLGYHLIALFGILILFIGSIVNLFKATSENLYDASLIAIGVVLLGLVAVYTRTFALRAQDRAIKAEESLRYFILTQKRLPEKLSVRQIVGLRFASDEELPALVERVLQENLSQKDIKKAIKNWNGDYYRV